MITFRSDFENNIIEVESYFEFLSKIDQGSTTLLNGRTGTDRYDIDFELVKILKANAFLLMYNLVESTMRNGLWEIHSAIINERIDYRELISKVKEVLINQQVRSRFEYRTKDETVVKTVYEIIESAMQRSAEIHPSEKQSVRFNAGNLDVETITATFLGYGLKRIHIRHAEQERAFVSTKVNRNQLAHGNTTFKDCGKDYSYDELDRFKTEIVDYLRKVIDEIDDFITNKRFKIAPPAPASASI